MVKQVSGQYHTCIYITIYIYYIYIYIYYIYILYIYILYIYIHAYIQTDIHYILPLYSFTVLFYTYISIVCPLLMGAVCPHDPFPLPNTPSVETGFCTTQACMSRKKTP